MEYSRLGMPPTASHGSSVGQQDMRELDDHFSRRIVVTVLGHATRQKVDLVVRSHHAVVHAATVREAFRRVREEPMSTFLVSPDLLRVRDDALLSITLSTTARAVVLIDRDSHDPAILLLMGACGLREALDLRSREGWHGLRQLLEDESDPAANRVLDALLHHLGSDATGARRFFAHMVRVARTTMTVRVLANSLGVAPSTLMSRFYRAQLPSPKKLLAATRLLLAKALLEDSRISISTVSYQLSYSSPQAFGRHVKLLMGMTVGKLRRVVTFEEVTDLLQKDLIVGHLAAFRAFDPLLSQGRWLPVLEAAAPSPQSSRSRQ